MKQSALLWLAAFPLALALQGALGFRLALGGAQPDFVFLLLFAFALKHGSLCAIYVGFTVGLCQDLYSPALLGQHALCKSLTGAICGLFNERMMSTAPPMKAAILLLAFLLHDTVFWIVDRTIAGSVSLPLIAQLGLRSLPRALYSLLVASLYYLWQRTRRPSLYS